MFKIPFAAPELPAGDVQAASVRVTCMNAIVAELQARAHDEDNRFALLSKANRAALADRVYLGLTSALHTAPYRRALSALSRSAVFETAEVADYSSDPPGTRLEIQCGFNADAFDSDLYGSKAMRAWLIDSHRGRCAYCETLIHQSAYGGVEHFRPKAAYTQQGYVQYRPAYHALAYDPTNLFYACPVCNGLKGDAFPILDGDRQTPGLARPERAVLVNPYTEDPRDFIRFNPLNARAYPFDLVAQFYLQTRSWPPAQTEQNVWADATLIPAQPGPDGAPLSNPQADAAFNAWLEGVQDPNARRGQSTIDILGLNRSELIRARANHLRSVRGLLCSATVSNPDQDAAVQLFQALLLRDTTAVTLAPQYYSATLDGIMSWHNQATTANWVALYNQILSRFVPAADLVEPPPYNDSIMYIVLTTELGMVGKRRLIYLSDSDRVYGEPRGRALTLSIDWEEDLDNVVLLTSDLRGAHEVARLTLRELISGDPRTLYRKFDDHYVWAIGEYLPIRG